MGGLHHIRLKFVLRRGVEKPFGLGSVAVVLGKRRVEGSRTNVDKPKRKPKHFGNASHVVPLYSYTMATDQSCKGFAIPTTKGSLR